MGWKLRYAVKTPQNFRGFFTFLRHGTPLNTTEEVELHITDLSPDGERMAVAKFRSQWSNIKATVTGCGFEAYNPSVLWEVKQIT